MPIYEILVIVLDAAIVVVVVVAAAIVAAVGVTAASLAAVVAAAAAIVDKVMDQGAIKRELLLANKGQPNRSDGLVVGKEGEIRVD